MARAQSTTTLTVGLVSIPVKIYTFAGDESIHFNQISPAGNRVKQQLIDAVTGEVVKASECSKGYEVSKDQYVIFTQEEIDALEIPSHKTVNIAEFVSLDTVDLTHVEKTYFLGPDKGAEKSYKLLTVALDGKNKGAIAQWAIRGREHVVVIRPYYHGLIMQVLHYQTELRDMHEIFPSEGPVDHNAYLMATQLIDSLTNAHGYDPSKYKDRYNESVQKAVDAKIASNQTRAVVGVPQTTTLDLVGALKASLEQTPKGKKPRNRRAS